MRFGHRLVLCLAIVLVLTFFFIFQSPRAQVTYYLLADHPNSGYLDHVIETAADSALGRSQRPSQGRSKFQTNFYFYNRFWPGKKWDILWSHRYPFSNKTTLGKELKVLEWGKRVNKIPGGGWLSSKQALAEIKSKFIPKAFTLPEHYDDFINVLGYILTF